MPSTISVQLPDLLGLTRTLALRTNRHCHQVISASEQWFAQQPLLDHDERAALRALKVGLWAAVCFPTCDPPQLRLATDFLTALVVCAARLARVRARSMADCGWTEADGGSDNVLFRHVLPKIVAAMPSDAARDAFTASFDAFRAAQARVLAHLASGTLPGIDAYIELRRDLSGIPLLFGLIQMVEGLTIAPAPDPELTRRAADVIALSMDIVAYNNDQWSGNRFNVVSVIQAERGVSVQGAINVAFARVDAAFKGFVAARAVCADPAAAPLGPTSGGGWTWNPLRRAATPAPALAPVPAPDRDAQLYRRGLEDCIVGTLNWAYETELYFGPAPRGDEVRRYGWVFLREREAGDGQGCETDS
ncbi:isoprenoid synthase domain-containing protein [Mycena pura]|uniref:Isoprenoid synthase domain-containing protein n=1 Tax=Mycena pura TaxID=153505 RepID=A0AAD6VAT3_9AGAR|nr:isoprenoid synthase domain-containing protein [Mycena pura]